MMHPVSIPSCAWSRPIGQGWQQPYTVRYPSNLDDGPWHGAPLGGLGAGCIGRGSHGQFNLWHVDGGEHTFENFAGCQFSVFEDCAGDRQAYALATQAPADGSLSQWNWYPSGDCSENCQGTPEGDRDRESLKQHFGDYYALYPRSWFVYRNQLKAEITCEQFSPILANNYQETSYPIAAFLWTVHNPTHEVITLSLMLSWENMAGWFTNTAKSPDIQLRDDGSPYYDYVPRLKTSTGNVNRLVGDENRIGVVMANPPAQELAMEGDGEWAIATFLNPLYEVTYQSRWNPAGDGADLWQTFAQDGTLPNGDDETPAAPNERIGGAIAVKFTLRPGKTKQIPFILAWDFPVMEFAQGVNYFKRYTDFFGRTGRNSWTIAKQGLKNYANWQEQIQSWQQPIVDQNLPDWFKMALLNELYDLTQGGALWTAASELDPVGQFAVLECLDYRWYESLDVRLYGSFALLMLWPRLEKSVMEAFARAIPQQDDRRRKIGYYYTIGVESPDALRKTKGATPHDLGAPNEHVWEKTNYTSYQDCNLWKDLGSDFVLQVYRDYYLTGAKDWEFLQTCWPAVVETLHYLKQFDLDQDGIPENGGAPDQTFDDWKLNGVSAYCGGLWIAALEAAIAIAQILQITATATPDAATPNDETYQTAITQFQTWLAQARPVYHAKLWNGQFYRIDSASGSDVVMTDQLCGQFYARMLNLPDVVPADCARSALQTVYESCFVQFNQYLAAGGASGSDGRISEGDRPQGKSPLPIGAANGVRPNGQPENANSTHPLEVWTGINFGLAAFLLQSGLETECFTLTEAVVRQIYDNGLQFRTPEAITANATFRASHYLRAMAIWGIYGVFTGFPGGTR
ncbi:MAG: GH116 family glycosyl hydrolase [Synechococcales bacterium]|nr:GH116 family glycosyl hydrolase [Synechococcales bacterium]